MLNQAEKDFIKKHLNEDVRKLALQIQSKNYPGINTALVLNQIAARQKSKTKIPSWAQNDEIIYSPSLSLEQSSSEITAKYKARLLSGNRFVDLTGGFGVDSAFIAPKFKEAIYVERQKELVDLASWNFNVLNLHHIQTKCADATEYLEKLSPVDCIFIDPARRSESGKKVVLLQDCEPNLLEIQEQLLNKSEKVLVKLSPMLDIQATLKVLKNVAEIHIISLDNECKELLFLQTKNFSGTTQVICVNFNKKEFQSDIFFYSLEKETLISYASKMKRYLYEPNASILKAGFYKSIVSKYQVEKLHVNSHLYTSELLKNDFPGRIFEVISISSLNKTELKNFMNNVSEANLSVRNFPLSVNNLRKKLKLKEGGDLYLFATTLSDGQKVLIKTRQIFEKYTETPDFSFI